MRTRIASACLLLLAACAGRHVRAREAEEVAAETLSLPTAAALGMFITWSVECNDDEADATREETMACVDESGGLVTMERRETFADGSTEVTASRFRRDGTLVGAWRGPSGGLGSPLRIRTTPTDWDARAADVERLRSAYGLPPPKASSSQDAEWVETPAGRLRCVRHTTKVSVGLFSGRFTLWYAVSPLPLSSLVQSENEMPGFRMRTTLKAFGSKGARPTLSIPPGDVAPSRTSDGVPR